MHYNWNTLNLGGKLMSIGTLVAVISIFLPWFDAVRFSYNGFQELAFLLLALYVYPVWKLLNNQPISLPIGATLAIIAAAASVGYMQWKTIVFEGQDLCFAGHGTYIFFFASVLFLVGILKYQPTKENPSAEETVDSSDHS